MCKEFEGKSLISLHMSSMKTRRNPCGYRIFYLFSSPYLQDQPNIKFQGIKPRESVRVRDHYLSLLDEYDSETLNINKIVIHGVHQFTPLIHRMIMDLKALGIEITFLINDLPQYPRIFQTWREVYKWVNPNYISDTKPFYNQTTTLGKAIGELIHETNDTTFERIKSIFVCKFPSIREIN